MSNILSKYGIKEVADVTFYELDDAGNPTVPVLYLDTLKVSTIEQTAETAEARGGKGNPSLIVWDYGKEINVTLEDALFSPKSMSLLFGDGQVSTEAEEMTKTVPVTWGTNALDGSSQTVKIGGVDYPIPTTGDYYKADGTKSGQGTAAPTADDVYYKFTFTPKSAMTINIGPDTFPGTYYVTGETYARSEASGKDEAFQFVIAKAKVLAENTITMEAEGDPSVFNMNLRVLRPTNGDQMMKLIKYDVAAGE